MAANGQVRRFAYNIESLIKDLDGAAEQEQLLFSPVARLSSLREHITCQVGHLIAYYNIEMGILIRMKIF